MELVILCGLQASGKSTFQHHKFPDHVVISKDRMRNNRRKERRQRELVEQALTAGRSVVVDNTNPSAEDRRPLTTIGHAFGARIIGYYFEPDFELCIARNATRSGRDVVPYVGLVDVARRLRAPGSDEGFDELWTVRTTDGRFDVSPLPLVGRDG